ncbi:MAG: ATP-binding protein [Planctomycetota bacterium]
MTRLFLRFYLGVIGILLIALMIQTYLYSVTSAERNLEVIEQALGGGALLARDEIIRGGEEDFPKTMRRLESRFDYPIRVIEREERPMSEAMIGRIDNGEPVLFWGMIQAAIPESPFLVELGPLPQFAKPTRAQVTLAITAVFLLTAGAIAFLLRPVVNQLRVVERAALAIAAGDLSARIDDRSQNTMKLSGAFNTMADRVEDSLRAQRELLQSVSHELRTPLSRIRFASELIRTAKTEEQRDERIVAIESATDQLDELVGELLTFARYDAQSDETPAEWVELGPLIQELVVTHQTLAPETVQLQFQHEAMPEPVLSHRGALARAIGNLLGNACKYARSKVEISAEQDGESLTISVDDDGVGIDPDDRERVFEPFHRASAGSQPGYGLGLALVRRICRRLGGDVAIADSQLGGARLIIRIPLAANPQPSEVSYSATV